MKKTKRNSDEYTDYENDLISTGPKVGDRRIGVCDISNKEVVQQLYSDGWLCLHNDTPEEDALEVEKFRRNLIE